MFELLLGIPSAYASEDVTNEQPGGNSAPESAAGEYPETLPIEGENSEITETVGDGSNQNNTGACDSNSLGSTLTLILPLLLMVVVFYFLLIRPQKKKEKQVKAMLDALKPGDRVTTIGGIYGTVSSIKDDMITLTVGISKTEMVFARWAIRNVDEQGVDNDTEVLA